jgi:hypothetical protein
VVMAWSIILRFCLQRLSKTLKTLSQDSQYPCWHFNSADSEQSEYRSIVQRNFLLEKAEADCVCVCVCVCEFCTAAQRLNSARCHRSHCTPSPCSSDEYGTQHSWFVTSIWTHSVEKCLSD